MSLSFYTVQTEYCDFLREKDSKTPYTMDSKASRPFVGVVFTVNDLTYYAPLTSPKKKHIHMKNQVDFLKIDGGKLGAINFNNMIPVPMSCLNKVDVHIRPNDTPDDIRYKNLLANQLSWCTRHEAAIQHQAQRLYDMVVNGKAWDSLLNRCCDFANDEIRCCQYQVEHFKPLEESHSASHEDDSFFASLTDIDDEEEICP